MGASISGTPSETKRVHSGQYHGPSLDNTVTDVPPFYVSHVMQLSTVNGCYDKWCVHFSFKKIYLHL